MFLFVCLVSCIVGCFFFKQKTAYEMRISDWSSDVCSSDLPTLHPALRLRRREDETTASYPKADSRPTQCPVPPSPSIFFDWRTINPGNQRARRDSRSEEHTSELQSLMRISYAVFCLKKKDKYTNCRYAYTKLSIPNILSYK